jgi:hypothetical protein
VRSFNGVTRMHRHLIGPQGPYDDEEEEESLADTEADAPEQQRGADSLADTDADVTLVQEDRHDENP